MKIKYRQFIAILTINLILVFSNLAFAQSDQRIRFAKGKSSATINGVFTKPNSGENYLFGAKSGQKLTVNFEPDSGAAMPVVQVFAPGKKAEPILDESSGEFEVDLEKTGDYTIFVGCAKRCRYELTVSIR